MDCRASQPSHHPIRSRTMQGPSQTSPDDLSKPSQIAAMRARICLRSGSRPGSSTWPSCLPNAIRHARLDCRHDGRDGASLGANLDRFDAICVQVPGTGFDLVHVASGGVVPLITCNRPAGYVLNLHAVILERRTQEGSKHLRPTLITDGQARNEKSPASS